MNPKIEIVNDSKRGCGWRKKGGIYMMGGEVSSACGRLPIPLTVCPCCGNGIKQARGWTWVDGNKLMQAAPPCKLPDTCFNCPVDMIIKGEEDAERAGLLWIGARHYPTPSHFVRESKAQGISRRLATVPKDLVVGETVILLAHPRGIASTPEFGEEVEYTPTIFGVFKPSRLEIVVKGTESEEEIDALIARGLTPVFVRRLETTQTLMGGNGEFA